MRPQPTKPARHVQRLGAVTRNCTGRHWSSTGSCQAATNMQSNQQANPGITGSDSAPLQKKKSRHSERHKHIHIHSLRSTAQEGWLSENLRQLDRQTRMPENKHVQHQLAPFFRDRCTANLGTYKYVPHCLKGSTAQQRHPACITRHTNTHTPARTWEHKSLRCVKPTHRAYRGGGDNFARGKFCHP